MSPDWPRGRTWRPGGAGDGYRRHHPARSADRYAGTRLLGCRRPGAQRELPCLVRCLLTLFGGLQGGLDGGTDIVVLRSQIDRLERLGTRPEDLADRRVVEVRVLERLEIRVGVDRRRGRQVVHLLEDRQLAVR